MKVQVTRTSVWDDTKMPCEEARLEEKATYLDYRTAPTIEEARKESWFQDWWENGTNHREDKEKKMIVAERPSIGKVWSVEINSLEELLAFYKKYGALVITEGDNLEIPMEIEIYDDYRE